MKSISNLQLFKDKKINKYIKFYIFIILAFTISLIVSSNIVNAKIKEKYNNQYNYYTKNDSQVKIELNKNIKDSFFAYFTKDNDGKIKYQNSITINPEENNIILKPEKLFNKNEPNIYYVCTTNIAEDKIKDFKTIIGETENGDLEISNELGEKLNLRKISVIVDDEGPTISSVEDYKSFTNKQIKMKFSISDFGCGVDIDTLKCTLNNRELDIHNDEQNDMYYVNIDTPENSVLTSDVIISVSDKLGNHSSNSIPFKIDKKAPEISIQEIKDAHSWKAELNFEVKITDLDSGIDFVSTKLKSNNCGIANIKAHTNKPDYYIVTVTGYNCFFKDKIVIYAYDKAGNKIEKETADDLWIDKEPPKVEVKNIAINPIREQKITTIGDKLIFTLQIKDEQSGVNKNSINVKINNVTANKVSNLNDTYVYELELTKDKFTKDNQKLQIQIECLDISENKLEKTHYTDIVIFLPLDYKGVISEEITYQTDNKAGEKYAVDGGKIFISFKSTHPVIPEGIIKQNKQDKLVKWENTKINNGTYIYTGAYEVINDKDNDAKEICYNLKITDEIDKKGVNFKNKENQIIYYAPIKDCIKDFKLYKNNNISSNKYVKDGDEINITFKTSSSHKILPVDFSPKPKLNLKFANQNLNFTVTTVNSEDIWKASCKIKSELIPNNDNNPIPLSFELMDNYGNESYKINEINSNENLIYYAPITLSNINMVSNNIKKSHVAKNENIITISFTSNHPIEIYNPRIGNSKVIFTSESNEKIKWTGTYTVANGDTNDTDFINFIFTFKDSAENTPKNERDYYFPKIKYFAPISISSVNAISTNTKDGKRYIKDDDVVTISFDTNHAIDILKANITGNDASSINNINDKSYNFSYMIKNGDMADQSELTYDFTVTDEAGNGPITQNNFILSSNTLKYFAPIQAKSEFYTDNVNKLYAKNQSTLYIDVTANHNISLNDCKISDRTGKADFDNSSNIRISYTIPENEIHLNEGLLSYKYIIEDAAGNVFSEDKKDKIDSNQIIYDRTRPVITTSSPFSGFTNKSYTYTVTFSDTNLNSSEISLRINGKEIITDNDRASINKNSSSFTKTMYLSNEDTYEIIAFAKDMADNSVFNDTKSNIIIDKTNPEIESFKIQLNESKTFKKGFVLSDYFQINDKFIREIVCIVTDQNGSQDWDVDEPIISDGKKSVYMTATDMSNNSSIGVTYDFFIDGTSPQLLVKESKTNTIMSNNFKPCFESNMVLKIKLNDIHMPNQDPDKFTKLEILDEEGNVIKNILKDERTNNYTYTIPINELGNYTLVAEAVDDVGNEMDEISIQFELKDKPWFAKFFENKLLFYGSTITISLIIISIIILSIKVRNKRKEELFEELSYDIE